MEVTLKSLLASKMRYNLNSTDRKQIFEYEGAAGSFSSKIIIAYAFKLIISVHTAYRILGTLSLMTAIIELG